MNQRLFPLALLSLALPTFASLATAGDGGEAPGAVQDHTFREPPVGAPGVRSLAELRGRPVLVDFWGTR